MALFFINRIATYRFTYNYDIPTETVYPGNVIKCCILSRSSLNPGKTSWDGDLNYNCLPGRILFYANKDRTATPADPGVFLYEGTEIIVPDTFEGNDITKVSTFVKCYSDEFFRKKNELIRTATQLNIKCESE